MEIKIGKIYITKYKHSHTYTIDKINPDNTNEYGMKH